MSKYQPIRKRLEASYEKSETLRSWFKQFMKRKKILFPYEARSLLLKIQTMECGHWCRNFEITAIYVYYESGRYGCECDGIKIYPTFSVRFKFKRKDLVDELAMMRRVVQIEIEHKKTGNEVWEKWV